MRPPSSVLTYRFEAGNLRHGPGDAICVGSPLSTNN